MEPRHVIQTFGKTLILLAGTWVALFCLLPIFLPFVLGLLPALAAEPFVRRLENSGKLPRWLCSGLCVGAVLSVSILILFFLCRSVCRELTLFLTQLPELAASLSGPMAKLQDRLLDLAGRFPDGLGLGLKSGIRQLFQSSSTLLSSAYPRLFSWAAAILGKLPDLFLFFLTALLSSFMLSAELPSLRQWSRHRLPAPWQAKAAKAATLLKSTLGGWCKAQLKLMAITAAVLTVGFFLLEQQFPVLLGLSIALIDMLPVFGTGTILIPWGLVMFARGQSGCGLGLVILYGVTALLRTALEPRLLGRQMGLSPLLTLAALYVGYRLLGIGGMILFPLGALMIKQLWLPATQ